jgi:hypothetical protein
VQRTLYESVVDRLPLRSMIGAILLGCFYTFWVYANTRADAKDKFGVLHDFSPTARHGVEEFVAVRRFPNVKEPDGTVREERVTFKKSATGKTIRFVDDRNRVFRINDSQSLTVALELKTGPDSAIRYDAKFDERGVYDLPNGRSARFTEAGGKRFIEADAPGVMYAPSSSALAGALALNAGNFLIWLVVFWPCLRFTLGHAVGGAFGFGLFMMLFCVPLLFEKNQVTVPVAVESTAVTP